ncbi:hypothetical protein M0805_001719 [Coniferiporia weirii]|nr:hypothetical protein M0805_001719 [Coniferiporia weirii]
MSVFHRIGVQPAGCQPVDRCPPATVFAGDSRGELTSAPTQTLQARAETSSEAAALPNGQKALTPIIAGTISGTCVGVAWLVALIVVFVKRRRRKKSGHAKSDDSAPMVFIVPPDPAVVEGICQPGEQILIEKDRRWWRGLRTTEARGEGKGKQKQGDEKETPAAVPDTVYAKTDDPTAMNEQARGKRPHRPPYLNRLSTIFSLDSSPVEGLPNPESSASNFLQVKSNDPGGMDGECTSRENPSREDTSGEECVRHDTVEQPDIVDTNPGRSSRHTHRYPPIFS